MKKVTVYSMLNCPYCVKAKALLDQRGVKYENLMIDDWSDAQWDEFVKKSGMKTVPQVYVDGVLIGGYTQLADADAAGTVASWK
ncbi:MAG: glutathione S-transferase N-terminal domain-containing protein [Bdellovibrionales bacterium]|nr:glutathione S-transferase N-terminal domain-containing protein [Bdellovibrionales bacterium]